MTLTLIQTYLVPSRTLFLNFMSIRTMKMSSQMLHALSLLTNRNCPSSTYEIQVDFRMKVYTMTSSQGYTPSLFLTYLYIPLFITIYLFHYWKSVSDIYNFFFTFFSLGTKTADMYKCCEVNTS